MRLIQILGTGCPKCRKLTENAEAAAKELGVPYEIVKITDINEILTFGVMMTPGLAIDGKVKSVARDTVPDQRAQEVTRVEGTDQERSVAHRGLHEFGAYRKALELFDTAGRDHCHPDCGHRQLAGPSRGARSASSLW